MIMNIKKCYLAQLIKKDLRLKMVFLVTGSRLLMFKALGLSCVALLASSAGSVEAGEDVPLFSADRFTEVLQSPPELPRSARISRVATESVHNEHQVTRSAREHTAVMNNEHQVTRSARERTAVMNMERLAGLKSDVQWGNKATVRLTLFADTELKAVFERIEWTTEGYTLTGHIEGQPHSTVVLTVNGDMVAGMVWTHEAVHTIEAIGGAAVIRQAGPGAFGKCPTLPQPTQNSNPAVSPPGATGMHHPATHDDDGSVIDLLVVYPSLVRRSQGGHRFMRTLIDRDVALTNEAYRASGAAQRINLVAAVEVEYAAAEKDINMFRILDHLVDPESGYLDEVHRLRDSYAADLVLVHRGDLTGIGSPLGNINGITYQLTGLSEAEAPLALSVSDSFAFPHELGHNMGLRHDRSLDVKNTPFPYSHGYVVANPPAGLEGFHTIMAYGATDKHLLRFSNPNQKYPDAEGVPLGVPGDQPSDGVDGPADAARSLNETRKVVANYRRSANRCAYSLSQPSIVPASGGTYRVQIATTPDCTWVAHSNDPFISIAPSASGIGTGSVDYTVSANPSVEREVALMIAGEVHLTKQMGTRTWPPVAVCERSESVRYELEDVLGKPCADISAQDLASLRKLHVNSFNNGGLRAGDFLGLVNLLGLEVENTNMTTLPANVFNGLPNLFKLTLQSNKALQTIQSGAFNGLANLYELEISQSGLTSLQPGAFQGLYNLHRLSIYYTPVPLDYTWKDPDGSAIMSLQPGAFHGLYNLHVLELSSVQLATLHEGTFDGLSELSDLIIASRSLRNVAPGAFRGLSKLKYLVFNDTSITTLPPNIFADLENLEDLILRYNQNLRTLPPGVFNHLLKLTNLEIHESALKTLPSGLFNGLSNLEDLFLAGNGALTTVEPNAFTGLENLEDLILVRSALTALTASSLRGLSNLRVLDMNENAIADISGLSTLTKLEELYLANNLISDVAPLVSNSGLGAGDYVRLDGNPWSADAVAVDIPALRQRGVAVKANAVIRIAGDAQAEEGEPLVFPVVLQPPQTHEVTVGWEAVDNGSGFGWADAGVDYPADQHGILTLPAGAVTGSFSVQTLEDDQHERDEWFFVIIVTPPRGQLVDGLYVEWNHGNAFILDDDAPLDANRPPQAISGVADIYAVAGTQIRLPVTGLFTDPDGDALTVTATSTNPAVATADSVQAGMVTIKTSAPGLAGVVLTATDTDGESAALAFAVRVSGVSVAVVDSAEEDDLMLVMGDSVRVDLLASFRELDPHALLFIAQSSNPDVATLRIYGNSAIIETESEGSTQIVVTATNPLGQIQTVQFTVTVDGTLIHSRLPAWLLPLLVSENTNEESQRE